MTNNLIRIFKNYKTPIIIAASCALIIVIFSYYYKNFNLIVQIIYLITFFLAFLIPGYALLTTKFFNKLLEIEKFVFSFGISFFMYAILALFSGFIFGDALHLINLTLFIIINFAGIYFLYQKKYLQKIDSETKQSISWLSACFLLFIMFLQLFITLPFAMPDKLQDGPYVFKNKNNLHIQIQRLTGDLPSDNFVPYVFSQYLLRKISFTENRPMLPGQEVSNRTVLMGLNSAFFLSVFRMPEISKTHKIGTFSYVGSRWPDVGLFGNDNKSFSIFLTLGMILNATFLLAVYLLIGSIFGKNKGFGIMLILMIFPYTINQIIFTWPKFLMAYYLISAVYLVIKKSHLYVIGLFLALAFHSHPSAMVYIGFIMLYWLMNNFKIGNKKTHMDFLKIASILIAIIVPWIIWTKLIIKISSDLISQNAVANDHRLISLVKVRLDNLWLLFKPWQIQGAISWADRLFKEMVFTFAGAIGIYFIVTFFYLFRYSRRYFWEIALLFLGPVILLTMPWGKIFGSFSILYCQPAIPLFIAFGVIFFSKYKKTSAILLLMQTCLSVYSLWFGMYNLPLQITHYDIPNATIGFAILLQILFALIGTYFLLTNRKIFSSQEKSNQEIVRA